ncbi:hypothetical protein PUNSTDRAFT_44979 [Punctularia strigosozonata HHB-11173 SS5]|uniref:uncharacterized protein n=1 Tax=Punctularia strigosozonata (strain HHB-11173) TaxID=741275 RepID=UPI000441684B|nr:uncharacterized protein PUNSTDRAFT_44979 [Punctularia strigosozonata HHB-11173 SS5]EIN08483.1 hypothetical protein PUNSTDRAFT_44979 [Punctularia strigosozonata HHB-11173 SS5]
MILTQKPVHAMGLAAPNHHRRHPSAPPAVIVQPTKTPGLLSLSKPTRSTSTKPQAAQHHSGSRQRMPKGRQSRLTAAAPATDATTVTEEKSAPAPARPTTPQGTVTPEKSPRGRQNALKQPKDKNRRSNSVSQSRALPRGKPHHQASPPATQFAPEGEGKKTRRGAARQGPSHAPRDPNSNSFDPFLSSASDKSDTEGQKSIVVRTAPKITRPSGKLARRRQAEPPVAPSTPSPSARPIAVPRRTGSVQLTGSQAAAAGMLSRSEPHAASSVPRPVARRSVTTEPVASAAPAFPVCDDTTDAEDDSDDFPNTPPRDTRGSVSACTWQQQALFDDGPRTAPLSSTGFNLAFVTPPRPRVHQRNSSEGVFNVGLDEELSDDAMVYGLTPAPHSVPAKPFGRKFASSQFQNSPTPDTVPAPRLRF